MLFLNKPLDKITEQDLEEWVKVRPPESRSLEFKSEFYKQDEKGKHELCKDITALANTIGGHLVIGIETSKKNEDRAVRLVGIEEQQLPKNGFDWIYDVLGDRVEPKLRGVIYQPVTLSDGKVVLIIQVPQSVLRPHAVRTKDGCFEWWARNMQGCFRMDVPQIRQAFLASGTIAQRMREFRMNRLADLGAGQAPVELPSTGPLFVYHILPINAFDDYTAVAPDLHQLARSNLAEQYIRDGIWNFDGYLVARGSLGFAHPEYSYTQFHQNGCVEAVYDGNWAKHGDQNFLRAGLWEMMAREAILFALAGLQAAGMDVPAYITAAILRAKGCRFVADERYLLSRDKQEHARSAVGFAAPLYGEYDPGKSRPIDRDPLVFQEVLLEAIPREFHKFDPFDPSREDSTRLSLRKSLKPIFDRLWQAAGYSRSPYYDENGEPKPIPIQ